MNEPSELDVAQIRFEMRQLYKNIGLNGSLQVLYEMLYGVRMLAEVITEEQTNETR